MKQERYVAVQTAVHTAVHTAVGKNMVQPGLQLYCNSVPTKQECVAD